MSCMSCVYMPMSYAYLLSAYVIHVCRCSDQLISDQWCRWQMTDDADAGQMMIWWSDYQMQKMMMKMMQTVRQQLDSQIRRGCGCHMSHVIVMMCRHTMQCMHDHQWCVVIRDSRDASCQHGQHPACQMPACSARRTSDCRTSVALVLVPGFWFCFDYARFLVPWPCLIKKNLMNFDCTNDLFFWAR